jgi:hypothetical protein
MARLAECRFTGTTVGATQKNATLERVALIEKKYVDLFEGSFGFRNCLGDTGNDLVRVAL